MFNLVTILSLINYHGTYVDVAGDGVQRPDPRLSRRPRQQQQDRSGNKTSFKKKQDKRNVYKKL